MLNGIVHVRRVGIATVAATAFSVLSTASALANTPIAAAIPAHESGLPAPTSLVLFTPTQSQAPAPAEAVMTDAPAAIPAAKPATSASVGGVMLALIGLSLLVVLGVVAYAIWDLTTNNE